MIGFLLGAGIVLAYLAVGVLLARANSVRIYRRIYDHNERDWSESIARDFSDRETRTALAGIAVLWPLTLVVLAGLSLVEFVMAPVTDRQVRAARLRADAEHWTREAAEEIDVEKKALIEELARSLSEQAKEVDL